MNPADDSGIAAARPSNWRRWLLLLSPATVSVGRGERLRVAVGAFLGILVAALLCRAASMLWGVTPWLMAPLGASAVLVFAMPASPIAQPWPVLVGNTLSTLFGVLCASLVSDVALAGALAVSVAILVMFATRSLHPPGGAAALLAVIGGATPQFALFPVASSSLLLLIAGTIYNRMTRHDYPHRQVPSAVPARSRFTSADLDAALAHYNQVLDVSRADLAELLEYAEAQAYQRQLGDLKCADIMTLSVITADYAMPLEEAWRLMREHHIKALPVIDRARRLIGIVTTGDFLKHAHRDVYQGLGERVLGLVRASATSHSDKPEVVGQIMTRRVQAVVAARPVVDLLPLFADGGHHHVPIVDDSSLLAGIITQTDLIRALYATSGGKQGQPHRYISPSGP